MSIDNIPIWVLFAATVGIVMLAIEAGYQYGRRSLRRQENERESPVSAMVGSVLGLTAFMLAFTFGIVTDRFDARKELVRKEANAIGTAWLRADFLPERDRAEARQLFLSYIGMRVDRATQARPITDEDLHELLSTTKQIQERLWEIAVANARKDMNSDIGALYIESLNELIDIHALRVAVGLQTRIPGGIWLMLYSITSLGMVGLGYQTGIAGSGRSMARPILALSFALVITLISTLDRPNPFITVTQQPLIDLRNSLMAQSAGIQPHGHGGDDVSPGVK